MESYHIDKVKTGQKLQQLLEEKNITVKELKEMLGLGSVQAIYKWMNGTNIPTIQHYCVLSKLLGITIDAMIICEYTK